MGEQPVEELVGIGLGSNMGDRAAALSQACRALATGLSDLRVSAVYESTPDGFADQPDFLNACCVGGTQLSPRELLIVLKELERRLGRTPGGPPNGPRSIDCDLLLYGGCVIGEPDLVVPHPRLRERAFVLIPLAELAPDWEVPSSGGVPAVTVADLANSTGTQGIVRTNIRLHLA